MAIETAFVAPVLLIMSIGAYQTSAIVSRQQELQAGAADIEAIIMAANLNTGNAISSTDIENVMMTQLGLNDSQITLTLKYRCGTSTTLTTTANSCSTGVRQYKYVDILLTDTYTPAWTNYGIGSAVNYSVSRVVQMQ